MRLTLLALLVCASANATTIFAPTNGSSVYFQENPNAPGAAVRTLGQTFTVPAPGTDVVLTDFAFAFTSGTEGTFDYRAMLFLFDTVTSQASGSTLFTSEARNGSQVPSFTGLNIPLTPGLTYIAVVTTEGVVNDNFANGLLAHNSTNIYADGSAVSQSSSTSGGTSGTGSWTTTPFTPVGGGSDLQFSATFAEALPGEVPEPSSILLLSAGVGMLAMFRSRMARRP